MKKWIGLMLAVGLVSGGWLYARTLRVTMPWNMPKFAKIERGDIRVPVTSPGLIEPKNKIEVKSKAGGEIIEIPVKPGDRVKAGDVLVRLDPDEEQRAYDRTLAALELTKISLSNAKLAVDKARQSLKNADAQLEITKAEFPRLKMDLEQAERLSDSPLGDSKMDIAVKKSAFDRNIATQRAQEAAIEQARLSITEAENLVNQQEEALKKAEADLKDAQRRLNETTIKATADSLVTEVFVRVGEKIQSGTQSFTGGTKLMMLGDISELKVIAKVDEADYGRIVDIAPIESLPQTGFREKLAQDEAANLQRRSGKVKIRVEAYRDEVFDGVIERVEPQGKLTVGSSVMQFDVHVIVSDPNRDKLPLGAQAQVEFTVESVTGALVVAADAVKSHENKQGIWLPTDPPPGEKQKGKRFVPCRIGITDGEKTEIIATVDGDPLSEGTEVYTKLPPEPKDDTR